MSSRVFNPTNNFSPRGNSDQDYYHTGPTLFNPFVEKQQQQQRVKKPVSKSHDIKELDNKFIITNEINGYEKNEIKIDIEDSKLIITGNKVINNIKELENEKEQEVVDKPTIEDEDGNIIPGPSDSNQQKTLNKSQHQQYQSFKNIINLNSKNLDYQNITAIFENHQLIITIPKKQTNLKIFVN